MEFQLGYATAPLFADAVAAFIRSNADSAWLHENGDQWSELWVTFRDADTASVTVSREAGRLMHWVWGDRSVWRDEHARKVVTADLRPQWRAQIRGRAVPA
ncbi:hypothetical protein [Streptomyces werraensis]|uniref:hypothetical protein n=1 Tax=Streptomyces werraensis TaxID=68284 RepID=UPI0036FCF663